MEALYNLATIRHEMQAPSQKQLEELKETLHILPKLQDLEQSFEKHKSALHRKARQSSTKTHIVDRMNALPKRFNSIVIIQKTHQALHSEHSLP